MGDTLVAVGEVTADGSVILAKNSDRQPNEAQVLSHVPRAKHAPGDTVKCTYIEVPQVPETYEVLLSKPFWIWGCEMGANECGVSIGNEPVWTKEPYDKEPGLIGMDMVRLALERADTARKALDLIVELLETYEQGGNCGFRHKKYYHNAFIIADLVEAWVLEISGKYWAAEMVRGVRTISNGLTIGSRWDRASLGLVEYAIGKRWCKSHEDFDFGRCYSDRLHARLDGCRVRQPRSTELLETQLGRITVETMMDTLRDHGPEAAADPNWNPGKGWMMAALCAHASMGPTRPLGVTGSMVAHLTPGLPAFWLTGTAAPCTGIFKPVFLGSAGLPDLGPEPTGIYDPKSLWWLHERLHRTVIRDYAGRMPLYREQREILEASFVLEAEELRAQLPSINPAERPAHLRALSASCFDRAAHATARWTRSVSAAPVRTRPPVLFSLAWDILNRQAQFKG